MTDDDNLIGGRYRIIGDGPVAVQWNSTLADQFPDATHHGCLQSHRWNTVLNQWVPFEPPLCHGWHCPHCGQPCGSNGHPHCPNTTTQGGQQP